VVNSGKKWAKMGKSGYSKRGDHIPQVSNLLDKIGYFKPLYAVICTISKIRAYKETKRELKQLKERIKP
jgi:hypothetical protein